MTLLHNTLVSLFCKLVRIDSPSGHEQEMTKYVAWHLREAGWKPVIDAVGNVFVRTEGQGEPIFFCAHLDTVEPGEGIEPILEDGIIRSEGKTILGADNKAAVTALLHLLDRRAALPDQNWRPLEVLFTVSEEEGSGGADTFDYSLLQAKEGFVFDAGEPLGQVVTAAPYYASFDIKIQGEARHASDVRTANNTLVTAFQLVQAIEALRGEGILVNIGKLTGGSARNTAIGSLKLHGELRAFDEKIFNERLAALETLCKQDFGQPVHYHSVIDTWGYKHDDQIVNKTVKKIETILERSVVAEPSFGCSDANVFNTNGHGLTVFDIGDGVCDSHTFDEHISVADLTDLAKLAQGLAQA